MSDTKWLSGIDLSGRAKYRALADHILDAIEAGTLAEGARLPPVRQLAWDIGVTPGTVARAYSQLTDTGQLEAVVGRGTFVARKQPPSNEDSWLHAFAQEDGAINLFSPRLPDMGQVAAIRAALHRVADGPIADLMEYPNRNGFQPAREAAISWLSDQRLGNVGHKDVVLTHGGQNAISLVLQAALREQKPTIMVEELSYPGFRRAAETLRIEVVGVACDQDGLIPEDLERVARSSGARLVCTSPEVHNPTGLHTPHPRREAIVAACRRAGGVQILEDDCYRIGPARALSYRALWPEGVWYVSSISKTITPALRIGFAIAPEGRYGDLRRVAEYGFFGLARPLAEMARIILEDPQTQHVAAAVRERVAAYIRAAVNMLGGFDLQWRDDVLFLWLTLPRGWRAAEFALAAERAGIRIRSAEDFTLREGRAPHAVRICVNGHITLERFETAMATLRDLLNNPPEEISV